MEKKSVPKNFGFSDQQFHNFKNLLKTAFSTDSNQMTFWIYGSRARGSHQKYSDVDLLIEATPPLTSQKMRKARELFEESHFPYKVDLVQATELVESFREQIYKDRRLLTL